LPAAVCHDLSDPQARPALQREFVNLDLAALFIRDRRLHPRDPK
jgi:hypothetical protein